MSNHSFIIEDTLKVEYLKYPETKHDYYFYHSKIKRLLSRVTYC
jgi:hypothetical protein